MVRMAVETTVWSSAARNMPSNRPTRIVMIWRWVKTPLASGAAAAARASLRPAAPWRGGGWVIGGLSGAGGAGGGGGGGGGVLAGRAAGQCALEVVDQPAEQPGERGQVVVAPGRRGLVEP